MPEVTRHLDGETLKSLEYPEEYLGSADAFRKRLLSDAGSDARDKETPQKGVATLPFATVDKIRLFYRLEGAADRPVLVLSHSIGTDMGLWAPQVEELLPHFQILRYDTRGHGASDAPGGEYTVEQTGPRLDRTG